MYFDLFIFLFYFYYISEGISAVYATFSHYIQVKLLFPKKCVSAVASVGVLKCPECWKHLL